MSTLIAFFLFPTPCQIESYYGVSGEESAALQPHSPSAMASGDLNTIKPPWGFSEFYSTLLRSSHEHVSWTKKRASILPMRSRIMIRFRNVSIRGLMPI